MNLAPRFLTYTPWPGQLNNTRMCFETVLVLAYLTGRRLVLPKEYRRHDQPEVEGGFRPLHPRECFEFEKIAEIVPMLAREEYDRMTQEAPHSRVDIAFRPGTTVFCFPHAPPAGSIEACRLTEFATLRARILEMTPEMESCSVLNIASPLLEHFYAFFCFLQPEVEADCKRLVKDRVCFRGPIVNMAARIAATLGEYAALHVRRNDFLRQYPEQNLPPQLILGNVLRRVPSGARLYIATDEDPSYFAVFRKHYDLRFLSDFAGAIPNGTPLEWIACIEQVICSSATVFIGTRLSTFSGYVTRLRGYRGAADRNTYFTDGSPGSELDDRGMPRFSWANWVKSGRPIWGREFREGWELG